jgi:DNA-binding NtrC family response regulator
MDELTERTNPPLETPGRAYEITAEFAGNKLSARVDESTAGPLLVGSSEVCALRIVDKTVSRRHLSLELVDKGLRVVDLGSANGTHLGATLIQDAVLSGGERLRLGAAALTIRLVPGPIGARPPQRSSFGRVVGASPAMQRLYPLMDRIAGANVPVIIEGETGTGKELLAEALHAASPVANGPYVVFDCTATHPSLVESELFGHERGAFTGAVSRRAGVFELAHKGTLLIDEIGDLDLSLQPKLLRVLERGEVRRVGGSESIAVDVRILAATRRDLDHEVAAGRFRDDLFHRLAVVRVELPALRHRKPDIALLAKLFWERMGGDPNELPMDALARWVDHSWPGNVRELRNAVARRLALGATDGNELPGARPMDEDSLDAALSLDLPLPELRRVVTERLERKYVRTLLEKHGGNVTRAADAAGIALRHFHRIKART